MQPVKPSEQTAPMFDDALPEKLLAITLPSVGRVQLQRGLGVPSPFIVKLREGEVAVEPSIEDEVAKLAQSLIIDVEDDAVPHDSEAGDALSLALPDIASQLREFDAVVSEVVAAPRARLSVTREAPIAPLSLEEALARLDLGGNDIDDIVPADITECEAAVAAPVAEVPVAAAVDPVDFSVSSSPWVHSDDEQPMITVRRMSWYYHPTVRSFAAFLGLSFALVLPLQAMQTFSGTAQSADTLTAIGRSAIDDLAQGAAALSERRFGLAQDDFSRAAEKFSDAEAQLDDLHAGVVAVVNVIPETDRTYTSVRGLVAAGRALAQTAEIMSDAATDIAGTTSVDLVTKLELFSSYVENALPHAEAAALALEDVDPTVVPDEYALRVAELQAQAPAIAESMREFVTLIDTLATLLGGDEKMRYLAVFQNNTEIRPTGGFLGSFAEMDVRNGVIESLRVPGGGTYDIQGQLQAFVEAPDPLQLINPRWEFQDANWFPDFPTSARKMQWFYEQAGGPTTDGVVAVNAKFIVDLLAILGPVDMPEYGRTIDAENFMFEAQSIVELEYDKVENTPKAFIGDLAPIMLERITKADVPTLLSVINLLEKSLHEREVQVFFSNNQLQSVVYGLGWTGEIKHTDGDYLMVVDTNVGGGKTDGVIDQHVDVQVEVQDDGSIINTVTISRTHQGLASALFSGKNNVDYLRLYVPEGSELLEASGFTPPPAELFEASDVALTADDDLGFLMTEKTVHQPSGVDIWQEFGKTVFGQWAQTGPGETSTMTFRYRVPLVLFEDHGATDLLSTAKRELGFGRGESYSLFVQKQPGVASRTTSVSLSLPNGWGTPWTTFGGGASAQTENTNDAFFGWLVTRN